MSKTPKITVQPTQDTTYENREFSAFSARVDEVDREGESLVDLALNVSLELMTEEFVFSIDNTTVGLEKTLQNCSVTVRQARSLARYLLDQCEALEEVLECRIEAAKP